MTARDSPDAAAVPRVFTDDQQSVLKAALNRIIPREGPMPAAGDLHVGTFIERYVQGSLALRRLFLDGLRAIAIAGARYGGAFIDLSTDEQDDVLRRVEEAEPLFFGWLVDLTYRGYYVHPDAHAALAYDGRPPQPRGFAVPKFDEGLLSRQKNRLPLWRPTSSLRPESPEA